MSEKTIQVVIDDRVRLMSAVLAATTWPDKAQEVKMHRPHAHARNTTKRVVEYNHHPAVAEAQALLDKHAPLEALYTYLLKLTWPDLNDVQSPPWVPDQWNYHLRDFYEVTQLAEWWQEEHDEWVKAQQGSETLLQKVDFYEFLKPFVGEVVEQLVFMPNISYPSERSVGMRVGGKLVCIVPPRIAWGDNPPWPFDEDPAHLYQHALSAYARLLMLTYLRQHAQEVAPVAQKPLVVSQAFKDVHPTWGDQFTELFAASAVALFLETSVSKQEAQAYVLMQNKARGLKVLPGAVHVLRRYLHEQADGKYQTFIHYLPSFPSHLRVAKSISSL
jgi:hypothetical protein